MKKISLLIITFFTITLTSFAQEEPQTLFKSENTKIGGFGGPIIEMSGIDGDVGLFVGGGGGVILNNFYIGGYGTGLTTNPKRDIELDGQTQSRRLNFGHGGLWLGYDFKANRLLHLTLSTKIGWGAITYIRDVNGIPSPDFLDPRDDVFVLTPEIGVEMNMTKFFKIALTGSYRWVNGLDLSYTDNEQLSSPGVNLTFKFGWFDTRK